MIGALGLEGVHAMMTVEGATDGAVFEAFVTHLLVPRLKPGYIVVLDNVGARKPESAWGRQAAEADAAGREGAPCSPRGVPRRNDL